MRRVGRGIWVVVLVAAAGGCAAPPYVRDPLIRDGRSVRGDRQAAAEPVAAPAEPDGPTPPPGPLVGDPGHVRVTSR